MRRLIDLRKAHSCFGRGPIHFLGHDNAKILSFIRSDEQEDICVVVNLSHHAQMVQLDLAEYAGRIPEDLFSRNRFLPIKEEPYCLTLSPHAYYILNLLKGEADGGLKQAGLPRIKGQDWPTVLNEKAARKALETRILPAYLPEQRWYGGKARKIRKLQLRDWIPLSRGATATVLLLIEVIYHEGADELYILPLGYQPQKTDATAQDLEMPPGTMAWLLLKNSSGPLCEAVFSDQFGLDLLSMIAGRKRLSGQHGRLHAAASRQVTQAWRNPESNLTPKLLGAEQSNTSIIYGDQFIFKLYRRTDIGIHPDVEMVRYLTEKTDFQQLPAYAGSLEYRNDQPQPIVIGLMQQFVANQGDAWQLYLDLADNYLAEAAARDMSTAATPKGLTSLIQGDASERPAPLDEIISGMTLEMSHLLGKRTAEMHLALAGSSAPGFRPEPFSSLYQRSLYQAMQNQANQDLRQLSKARAQLPEALHGDIERVLNLQKSVLKQMRRITGHRLPAEKIRIHGDYHLGQVLFTGSDFVILDFEGEPIRPLTERRIKRSPMRDVAGMIRSFHYAAYTSLLSGRHPQTDALSAWADLWYQQVSAIFLSGYLETLAGSRLLPTDHDQLEDLLIPYLLEKAVYELGYELNNRPDWLIIPLRGIQHLCGDS
jgi:maltose alpha-D-glucosyltransferase/alpha-amylase